MREGSRCPGPTWAGHTAPARSSTTSSPGPTRCWPAAATGHGGAALGARRRGHRQDAGAGRGRGAGASGTWCCAGPGWEDPGTPSFWVWSQVLRPRPRVRPPEQWGDRARLALPLLDGTGGGTGRRAGAVPPVRRGRRGARRPGPRAARRTPARRRALGRRGIPAAAAVPHRRPRRAGGARRLRLARPRRRRRPPSSASSRPRSPPVASRGRWTGCRADDVRALITATTGRDPGEVETRRSPSAPAATRCSSPRWRGWRRRAARARSRPCCPSRPRPPSGVGSPGSPNRPRPHSAPRRCWGRRCR